MSGSEVVGFDVATIDAWLPTVTDVTPPIEWRRLSGGHSNLTYTLSDSAGREFVIRRPPQGVLLPKAHDMWREFRIMKGLWPTPVPVAQPIAYCDDRAVAETHFYVMGKSEGAALYSGAAVEAWLDVPARRHAGEAFVDVLAALHSIDPSDVGLDDLGRHDGYVARQLSTWYRAWNAQIEHAQHDDGRVHQLHDLLSARIPEQRSVRVVHGDYGPHNALFSHQGDVIAVLDWELATLGDPLVDFAYSINAWVEPGDDGVYGADPPTALAGFPSRQQLIDRYAATTGADLSNLNYYRALNSWKVACILHGVYARYQAGQKSTEGVDVGGVFVRMDRSVAAAAEQASAFT